LEAACSYPAGTFRDHERVDVHQADLEQMKAQENRPVAMARNDRAAGVSEPPSGIVSKGQEAVKVHPYR
jgi:hypothetical protein